MTGTTINTYGTTAIELTQSNQNPVLVTATGTIITSGAYAIFENTGSPGEITNYGVLQSTSAGGFGVEFASAGNLANYSLVTAIADGVYVSGGIGTISNYGSISASGTAGDGAWLRLGGTLTNGSASVTSATITGDSDGVLMSYNGGTVQNYGTIAGDAGNGVEIDNNDGGTDHITNGGSATISGVIGVLMKGSGEITNSGTITGTGGVAVQLDGNDTMVVNSGAVFNGLVEGGTGTNTLDLAGDFSGLIGSEFIGFADFGVELGASWSLDGSASIQVVLNDGTISLSASATLSITGSISAGSSGIFQLGAGATLSLGADIGSENQMSFLGSAQLDVANASLFGTQVGTSSYAGPLLENFAAGDMIDLENVTASGDTLDYSASTGLLQVMSGSTDVATLAFQESTLGTGTFHIGSDSAGYATIKLD
jgi:hypothetical protein